MQNAIVILILAAVVAGIVTYLFRAKKKGQKCVGCPHSKQCSSKGCCGSGAANY